MKLTRKPSSGNPNAGFDVAGAGNVLKDFSGAPVLDPTTQKKYFCNSSRRRWEDSIVKQGNKFLCWALTEAAQTSVRCSEYFRYHYSRIRSRKNANSATIAVARRMLEIIYVMLKEGREYIEKPVDIK